VTVIFRDDFTGAGSTPLAGTAPDGTGFGSFLWSVDSTFSMTRTGGRALGAQVSGSWNIGGHYGADLTPDEIFVDASEFEASWVWNTGADGIGDSGIVSTILRCYALGGGEGNEFQARLEYGSPSISSLELIVINTGVVHNSQMYIAPPAANSAFPALLTATEDEVTLNWFGQTLTVSMFGAARPLTSIDIKTINGCSYEYLVIETATPPAPPVPKWTNYQNTYEVL